MRRTFLDHPAQIIKKLVPQGPTGHLLHKVTLTRLGDTAALTNTQKQTQRGSQNEEINKHVTN